MGELVDKREPPPPPPHTHTFGVMYDHAFSELANHQATHKVGSQPGDCFWSLLIFLMSLCGYVWVN